MTKFSHGTHVLVTDSEKALFLVNDGDGDYPNLTVERKKTQDNPSNREQSANRPGRVSNSVGAHRSAMDDTDWHQLAKDRFAADLGDILYERVHDGKIDRLIIVASPHVLGELRAHLHQEVTDVIVAEINKTLTNHPLDEIERLVLSELKGNGR